jgi:hypothetical protein
MHRWRRWTLIGVLGVVAAGSRGRCQHGLVGDGTRHFVAGGEAIERGKGLFLEGDLGSAVDLIRRAATRSDSAEDVSSNPILWAVGWLPIIGRTRVSTDRASSGT